MPFAEKNNAKIKKVFSLDLGRGLNLLQLILVLSFCCHLDQKLSAGEVKGGSSEVRQAWLLLQKGSLALLCLAEHLQSL